MPWTGETFKKHNKNLKGARAAKAASIANAMLRSGADEGVAIATASKYANKHKKLPHNGSISESVAKKHGYA